MPTLSDVAELRKEAVKPHEFARFSRYLGLEHIEPGTLRVNTWGEPSSVSSQKQAFHPGDTIYGKLRPYFRKVAFAGRAQGICSTDFWVLKPREGVDPRFVFYVVASKEFTDLADRSSQGTRMPRASWPVVRDFVFADLSRDEQRAIGETLGMLDEKIASNQRAVGLVSDLLDALSVQMCAGLPTVAVGDLATSSRVTAKPADMGSRLVDHFSLPAFDASRLPERVSASDIMSNKFLVARPSILVSRLNPSTNRTWFAVPTEGVPALASTEFMILAPRQPDDLGALWLAVRDELFMAELACRVTGTSGSHQRIRPDDALSIPVPDTRLLADEAKSEARCLLSLMRQKELECSALAFARETLLPELLFGRITLETLGSHYVMEVVS